MATSIPEDADPALIEAPGFPGVEASVLGDADPVGKWVVFKSCAFSTKEDANRAGENFLDGLLLVGAVHKLGVDIGFSKATLQFRQQTHDAHVKQHKRQLKADVHGLMVYEKDSVKICRVEARGSVGRSLDGFRGAITPWISRALHLTERQRTCAALLNDSFFVTNTDGQFILRVSAIEALTDQNDVGPEYQALIDKLQDCLAKLDSAEDTRESIAEMLKRERRQNVGRACRLKITKLLGDKEAKKFAGLYGKRSRFLHDGKGRGDLAEASADALELATKLLNAELTGTHAVQ